jgi:hypothetical protein
MHWALVVLVLVLVLGVGACGGADETVRPGEGCEETASSYVYLDGTLPTSRCREGREECAPRDDGMVECKCQVPCTR